MEDLLVQVGAFTGSIAIVIFCSTLFFSAIALGFTYFIIRNVMKRVNPNSDLHKDGINGQATILQVWQTGMLVNHNPQIGFRLQVQPPTGLAYEAQTTAVVQQIHLAQMQPGATLAVKIDPNDPKRVVIATA